MLQRLICLTTGFILSLHVSIAGTEEQFLIKPRQITFEGKAGEGYFSPDGKNLVFQSVREPNNPFYQIYILSLETGEIARVSPGTGKTTCAFFRPASSEVLFSSTHLDAEAKKKQEDEIAFLASGKTRRYSWDYDAQTDVFSAQRDGTQLRRLTVSPGYDAEGSYSPDGTKIVFTSLREAYPLENLTVEERKRYEQDPAYSAEIYLMNADGTGQTRLTHNPGYDGGPFFMPDGKRILWRRFETNGTIADVFTMRLDGSDVRRITRFESMSWAPFPHPSGKYIVFTSNKHGFENFELFIVDAEGAHAPVRVTYTDGFDGLPVFSPDGKKLCWTSNRGDNKQSQLFLASWNHNAALEALGLSESTAPGLDPEIKADDAREIVAYLAADKLEGRKTGEEGARKAADYIQESLVRLRIKPFGSLNGSNSFYDSFQFNSGVRLVPEQTSITVQSGSSAEFSVEKAFRPLSFSANGDIAGPVVFAGYGLAVRDGDSGGYDSYEGLEVTNKVVLMLRYAPEGLEGKQRQELDRYAGLREKAIAARLRGAKAILVVAGPNSPKAGELIPLDYGEAADSDIFAVSVTTELAEKILAGTGKTLKEIQSSLDTADPHTPKGFALTNVTISLKVTLERQKKEDRNVVGVLPGTSSEYVMVGAHYDHLGMGGRNSLNADDKASIHNGADDNASGVAAVLELAGYFSGQAQPLRRGIIFAFWSGEEMGLLGSSHFAENLFLSNIVAYLNFDMVGRLREDKLVLQGTGSSSVWRKLAEKRNVPTGLALTLQDDPYQPSDIASFYPKGIPSLMFFTGNHEDYHRPTDDADKLNYDGIERITKLARGILQDIASADQKPDYLKVKHSDKPGSRDALRVYLGSIPDYASDVKGVKLSGVRPDSPAEKGGLQGGDVIIEFAGQKIANIYDYTYALDAAKIAKPLKIKVLRAGKEVNLEVTPEARK